MIESRGNGERPRGIEGTSAGVEKVHRMVSVREKLEKWLFSIEWESKEVQGVPTRIMTTMV